MSEGMPQFSKAEYGKDAQGACAACQKPVGADFYRINGQASCSGCTQALRAQLGTDSHGAFVRAVCFGIGAAFLGLVLYVTVAVITGLVIGFVSLAVGFMVGKAMRLGSGGVRGRRYQVVAVILTYFAVSLSSVPIALYQMRQAQIASQQAVTPAETAPAPSMDVGRAVGTLTVMGLASPFLDLQDPLHGLIGLVILFVGVRIAWRMMQAPRLLIEGPLTAAPPPATAPV